MSGEGAPRLATLDGRGLRVAIVVARWHETVTEALLDGAQRGLSTMGLPEPAVWRAPGCFELPIVVRAVAAQRYQAVVALGAVIRGGTPHFEYVCQAVTDGLTRVALESGTPVGFGVLTCDDEQQALERCGLPGSHEDKGLEAAHSAVETALLLRSLRRGDCAEDAPRR